MLVIQLKPQLMTENLSSDLFWDTCWVQNQKRPWAPLSYKI